MNLIHVPLELLEERYSKQWFVWFEKEFKNHNVNYTHILPSSGLNCKIEVGEFLDVIKTNTFKAEQLQAITRLFTHNLVTKDTVFLFMDGWFPGLEMLAYLRDALKIPFKIAGIFHAGTWDQHDYLTKCGMKPWGQFCERAWFEIMDVIFVATQFHKNLIIENSAYIQKGTVHITDKIKVTGLPIYPDFVKAVSKENIIVFPHRKAEEKRPDLFMSLKYRLQNTLPDWQFIFSKDVCNNKDEYYDLLNRSRIAVSFAEQETFGIAMLEATLCGCIPIVPNKLSYKELYQNWFQYDVDNAVENAANLIIKHLDTTPQLLDMQKHEIISLGKTAITNIIQHCENLS